MSASLRDTDEPSTWAIGFEKDRFVKTCLRHFANSDAASEFGQSGQVDTSRFHQRECVSQPSDLLWLNDFGFAWSLA